MYSVIVVGCQLILLMLIMICSIPKETTSSLSVIFTLIILPLWKRIQNELVSLLVDESDMSRQCKEKKDVKYKIIYIILYKISLRLLFQYNVISNLMAVDVAAAKQNETNKGVHEITA